MNDCYSANPVVVNASATFTGTVMGGGFVGYTSGSQANCDYCYALGDVSISGYGNIRAGGFIGNSGGNALCSYAAGKVNVYSRDSGTVYAGGFSGYSYRTTNCYALGDVFVDVSSSSSSDIYAGALIGQFYNVTANTGERCFARGSVTVQKYGSGGVDAGGLAGYVDSSGASAANSFIYCAALGPSVSVTGGGTRNIGRVCGRRLSNTSTANNHANNDMSLTEHGTYGQPKSQRNPVTSITATTKVLAGKDGQDAHEGDFGNPTFWSGTLGFSSTYWDFNTVISKGYPRLKASDNSTVMGGQ
jgi:hypothetical protein